MKRIKDIRKLAQGTKIVNIHDGIIAFYEFLCVHPHCNEHVLLLDTWTQNAFKFLISNIEESANWQINYTNTDLLNYEYNYHLKKSDYLFSRIKAQKGK